MKTVRIASRGSKLALWQTEFVSQKLRAKGLKPEALIIKTKGDQVQDRFLHEIGGKGVFVRELEQAKAAYDDAENQLTRGTGNVIRQTEMLRELGAKVKKDLREKSGVRKIAEESEEE